MNQVAPATRYTNKEAKLSLIQLLLSLTSAVTVYTLKHQLPANSCPVVVNKRVFMLLLLLFSSVLQLRYVSSVFAGGQRCVALSDRNVMGFIASLHELASAERRFYCKLCNIKAKLLQPLLDQGENNVTGQRLNLQLFWV